MILIGIFGTLVFTIVCSVGTLVVALKVFTLSKYVIQKYDINITVYNYRTVGEEDIQVKIPITYRIPYLE